MMLAALLAAAAAATPQPAEVRTFQDWTVACDNGLACEAVALLPEAEEGNSDWAEWVTLLVRRGARPADRPQLVVLGLEEDPAALVADGRALPVRFVGTDDGHVVEAEESALIEALRTARMLELRDAGGGSLGRVSLAGASAAMLYMDEKQRRLDTVTALVRRGSRPASAVPAPPALPRVTLAPAPGDRPSAIDKATVERFRRQYRMRRFRHARAGRSRDRADRGGHDARPHPLLRRSL